MTCLRRLQEPYIHITPEGAWKRGISMHPRVLCDASCQFLGLSCHMAIAAVAATLRESTPWAMGMHTT